MSINDPHPWSPLRWLTESLYREMLKDWPCADKEYLFSGSLTKVEEAWPDMTEEEKEKFIKLSREDVKLLSNKSEMITTEIKGNENGVTHNRPKKPLSAYFLFHLSKVEAIKAADPELSILDISTMTGAKWRKMSDEECAPFKEEAKKRMEIYHKEMEEFQKLL